MQETWVRSLGREGPLEKEIATHSSILAWAIPQTKESGGLHSLWGHKEPDTTERLNSNVRIYRSEQERVVWVAGIVWANAAPSSLSTERCQNHLGEGRGRRYLGACRLLLGRWVDCEGWRGVGESSSEPLLGTPSS